MKFTWEEQDIKCGRKVDSHNRSERSIIGYDPSAVGHERMALISLSDGMMVVKDKTVAELAVWLNEAKSRPVEIDLEDHLPSEN